MTDNLSIEQIRTGLITIAARLVRGDGKPSPYPEDHKWAKTTPKSSMRYSIAKFSQTRDIDVRMAQAIKQLADALSTKSEGGKS